MENLMFIFVGGFIVGFGLRGLLNNKE